MTSKPSEQVSFDLVVVGGGLAGLCAAIAAARHGAKVAIIQDRPIFGGNCSSEVRVVPHGTVHSNAWGQETGLSYEMILRNRTVNHEQFFDHGILNSSWDLTMIETAQREKNLRLFFNTTARAVDTEDLEPERPDGTEPTRNGLGRLRGKRRRIKGVRASQMGSEKEFLLVAKQYVDATGDGTIGFLAGADFRYGREARAEFDENLAPIESDETTMGSTITMRARDIGVPVPYDPPPWIVKYTKIEEIGHKRTIYHVDKKKAAYGGYWWLEVCNPYHQIDDNQTIREELHRHVLGVWNFIKNHSEWKELASTYVLDWIGMVPGKRESRRLVGDVTVTENDCHAQRDWPDAIAFAGWWIDLHMKGGILNKVDPGERENVDRNYKHWIRIPPFSLPLRAFYSRNVENLWMCGRCLSVTHVALGPVRNMQTLAMMAHAVGLAAASALQKGLSPRAIADPAGPHLQPLRQRMLRDDVRILGLRNEDPLDLALKAKATASSAASFELEKLKDDWLALGPRRASAGMTSPAVGMIVPITHDRVDRVSFYLQNESDREVLVQTGIAEMETIWDRPDREPIVRKPVTLRPNFEGWVEVSLEAKVRPNRPHRIFVECDGPVRWRMTSQEAPGAVVSYLHVCAGGIEEKNRHLPSFQPSEVNIPAYRHWRHIPRSPLAIKVEPRPRPYEGSNVNNGYGWVDRTPNLWISDPAQALPQHVELDFGAPQQISRVELSFDTNLNRVTQQAPAFFRAPECACDFELKVEVGGAWRTVHAESGNYQRKRVITFEPVHTGRLRLVILATNRGSTMKSESRMVGPIELEAPTARLFEIRAYA